MSWGLRRAPRQLAAVLADGESVLAVADCVPIEVLTVGLPADDELVRTAVLTDRSLYCTVADREVVQLPFARMRELSRHGMALLFFRIDDSHATWELDDRRFAARAERRFAQHSLAAHRAWVGEQEPGGFRFHAHADLLGRLAAGTMLVDAVHDQVLLVEQLVWDSHGDRATCRAALRRLRRVHAQLQDELAALAEAAPNLSVQQHAYALIARPSPWEDGAPMAAAPDEGPTAEELAGLVSDAPAGGGPVSGR